MNFKLGFVTKKNVYILVVQRQFSHRNDQKSVIYKSGCHRNISIVDKTAKIEQIPQTRSEIMVSNLIFVSYRRMTQMRLEKLNDVDR